VIVLGAGAALRTWYQSKRNGEALDEAKEQTRETLAAQDKVLAKLSDTIEDFRDHGSGPARQIQARLEQFEAWRVTQDVLSRSHGEKIAVLESRYTDLATQMSRYHTDTMNSIERLRANVAAAIGDRRLREPTPAPEP